MRHLNLIVLILCLAALVFTAPAAQANSRAEDRVALLQRGINFYRQATWRWQLEALRQPTRTSYTERRAHSVVYLRWVLRLWYHRWLAAKQHATNPPHLGEWLCIHSGIKGGRWSPKLEYLGGGIIVGQGEAPWHYDGGTYDNGLQMDSGFQSDYGARLLRSVGPGYKWSPWQQMWVAEKAYRTRGFYPWPNTARACGLI